MRYIIYFLALTAILLDFTLTTIGIRVFKLVETHILYNPFLGLIGFGSILLILDLAQWRFSSLKIAPQTHLLTVAKVLILSILYIPPIWNMALILPNLQI